MPATFSSPVRLNSAKGALACRLSWTKSIGNDVPEGRSSATVVVANSNASRRRRRTVQSADPERDFADLQDQLKDMAGGSAQGTARASPRAHCRT